MCKCKQVKKMIKLKGRPCMRTPSQFVYIIPVWIDENYKVSKVYKPIFNHKYLKEKETGLKWQDKDGYDIVNQLFSTKEMANDIYNKLLTSPHITRVELMNY